MRKGSKKKGAVTSSKKEAVQQYAEIMSWVYTHHDSFDSATKWRKEFTKFLAGVLDVSIGDDALNSEYGCKAIDYRGWGYTNMLERMTTDVAGGSA